MKNLSVAEFFINIGKAILLLSFAKLLYEETGQIWAISLSFFGEILMTTILPMVAGRAVDTAGVRNVLLLSSVAQVLFCLIGIYLVAVFGISSALLLSVSILLSCAWPITRLGLFNVTPQLSHLEKLESNNGLLTFAFQAGQLVGMAAAGWLLAEYEFITILTVVTVLFAAAAVFYHFATVQLKGVKAGDVDEEDDGGNIKALLKSSVPFLPVFLLSNFDFVTVAIFNILLASVVAVNFDGNSYWLAGLDASFAIGAVFGGALIAQSLRRKGTSIMDVILVQLTFIVYLLLSARLEARYLMPLAVVFIGMFQSYSGIYWRTLLQKELPAHLRGRLTGVKYVISSAHVGVITLVISFAHEYSFIYAIGASIVVSLLHVFFLLLHKKKSALKSELQGVG